MDQATTQGLLHDRAGQGTAEVTEGRAADVVDLMTSYEAGFIG
jgi:hypothetical protein